MPKTKEKTGKRKLQTLDYYLSGEPVTIDEYNWMYADAKGILFVHEVRGSNGEYIRTDQVLIPYKKIEILGEDLKNARYEQKFGARVL
jgi:hypothetical protein